MCFYVQNIRRRDSYDSCLFLFEELVAVGGSTHGDIVRFSFTGFVGGKGEDHMT